MYLTIYKRKKRQTHNAKQSKEKETKEIERRIDKRGE